MLTKKDIYVKLGYRGEYTREVKRRFRLLCKRYHPDINHGDDTTMKLLNQVMEEIEQAESNRSPIKKATYSNEKEETSSDKTFSPDPEFDNVFQLVPKEILEQKIKQIEEKIKTITEELTSKSKKIYEAYQQYNQLLELIEKDKIDIASLKEESIKYGNQLFLFFGILVGTFFTILFFGIILGIMYGHYQNFYFWLVLFIFFIIGAVSLRFLLRVFDKKRFVDVTISSCYAVKNERMVKSFQLQDKIANIEEEYQILKDNRNKYANDRQLYYYEISKKQDRVIQRAKTKRYSSRR